MSKTLFVVDIDGTVADSMPRAEKISQLHGSPHSDYWGDLELDDFLDSDQIMSDAVLTGAEKLQDIVSALGAEMVFLTGRSERGRDPTRRWLREKLGIPDSVPLFMRPDDDHRPGGISKPEILKRHVLPQWPDHRLVFLDDDPNCLAAYARHGVPLWSPSCWNALSPMLKDNEKETA